ncbi:MAG: VanZ family protein [Polyangiales bacterium]
MEYAMLGLLALAALQTWPDRAKWRLAAVAIVVATGWGVLDEFHQAFVPTRSPDLHDIVADILGLALARLHRSSSSACDAPRRPLPQPLRRPRGFWSMVTP